LKNRKNIIFIGGIHGVGKTALCKHICSQLKLEYLSASQVLNWSSINNDQKNKNVQDIDFTQNLLIQGMQKLVNKDCTYVLDGHLCLFDKDKNVTRVPLSTFERINPMAICVITSNPAEIKKRLYVRDGLNYDIELLERMQEEEISYGRQLSSVLKIPFYISVTDNSFLITELQALIK
jgi:adenylate kinase